MLLRVCEKHSRNWLPGGDRFGVNMGSASKPAAYGDNWVYCSFGELEHAKIGRELSNLCETWLPSTAFPVLQTSDRNTAGWGMCTMSSIQSPALL